MGFEIDSSWTARRITTGSKELHGYVRKSGSLTEEYPFMVAHVREITEHGGLLFQRIHDSRNWREILHPGGLVGYQCDLPDIEMWYLPECSFEDALGLVDTFGFPSPRVCERPDEIGPLSRNLLRELGKRRRITVTVISRETVTSENLEISMPFSIEEVTGILEFNQRHFGIKYGKSEHRDLLRNYRKKGFFILGKM